MKKKVIIVLITSLFILLTLFVISNKKNEYVVEEKDFNLGDAIAGILYNSNIINFSDNSMASKNVQNAIYELNQAYTDGCAVGYEKGTSSSDSYTCNKKTPDSNQAIFFDSGYVNYDNDDSGLLSDNVSDTILELAAKIPDCKEYFTKGNITGNSYDCTRPYYTVNFVDNLFVARTQVPNDVTATYTENGSYLTLDGLSSTKFFVDQLWNFERRTFEEGDEYQITIRYVSGSYTRKKDSSQSPKFYFELTTGSGDRFSDRTTEPVSYVTLDMPTSGEVSTTYTVPSSRVTATGIQYRLYQATASNIDFDTYKVQIIITKVHSQTVGYGLQYGEMDDTSKSGFTFKGWYTGLFDGKEVKSTSINTVPSDQTIYAHFYYHKLHVKYKSWCHSVISWCGNSGTAYTMDSSCYALRNGSRIISSYGYGQYAGYKNGLMNWNNASSLCFNRSGQNGVEESGKEWKSVVTGTKYSQSTIYTASKLATDEGCSLLNTDDCSMTLQVNWMSGSSGNSSSSTCCPNGGYFYGGYCYTNPNGTTNYYACTYAGNHYIGSTCYTGRYSNSC